MTPSLPAAQPATYMIEGPHGPPARGRKLQGVRAHQRARRRASAARQSSNTGWPISCSGPGRTARPFSQKASERLSLTAVAAVDAAGARAGMGRHHGPTATANARMAEIKANLAGHLLCLGVVRRRTVEVAYFRIQGPTGSHRIRTRGRRRPHPHDLSRSDQ